jgi:predicted HTH transcriptional regulator
MWTPIAAEAQVPAVGTRETQWLDFKARAEPDDFEAAKDVAAFANGGGGTLLIGVAGGDSVQKIIGISEPEARDTQQLYELAIRDRCRPAPVVSFEVLRVPSGIVLAVNVHPFPGQIVGVKLKKGEAKCGAKPTEPEDLFYLPLRVGVHTRGIMPEQVPMFTDARIRRISAVLEQAVGQPAIVTCGLTD